MPRRLDHFAPDQPDSGAIGSGLLTLRIKGHAVELGAVQAGTDATGESGTGVGGLRGLPDNVLELNEGLFIEGEALDAGLFLQG
jgi:hypothetical protein